MGTVEERIASLEARVDAMADLRNVVSDLRGDMNRQFTDLRDDMNRQFSEVNRQFTEMRDGFEAIDQKADRHFLYLDQKIDRQFIWMVGTQLALLLAVVGALVGAYYR